MALKRYAASVDVDRMLFKLVCSGWTGASMPSSSSPGRGAGYDLLGSASEILWRPGDRVLALEYQDPPVALLFVDPMGSALETALLKDWPMRVCAEDRSMAVAAVAAARAGDCVSIECRFVENAAERTRVVRMISVSVPDMSIPV